MFFIIRRRRCPDFVTTSGITSTMGGMLIFLPGFYINLILWFCLHNETLQITKKQARIFSFVKLDICISRTIWIKDLKCYYLVVWLGHRQYIHRLWYLLRLHRIIDFFFCHLMSSRISLEMSNAASVGQGIKYQLSRTGSPNTFLFSGF